MLLQIKDIHITISHNHSEHALRYSSVFVDHKRTVSSDVRMGIQEFFRYYIYFFSCVLFLNKKISLRY